MGIFRRDPEPADRPQPNTVADTPSTIADCRADYQDRTNTSAPHPSSYQATPHTYSRH